MPNIPHGLRLLENQIYDYYLLTGQLRGDEVLVAVFRHSGRPQCLYILRAETFSNLGRVTGNSFVTFYADPNY